MITTCDEDMGLVPIGRQLNMRMCPTRNGVQHKKSISHRGDNKNYYKGEVATWRCGEKRIMSNDTNQSTIFDLFGGSIGFTPVAKAEPKKAEKKPAEKKAPIPVKKENFKLPLKAVSGYNTLDIEGEGEITLDELKERIFAIQNMFAPAITKVDAGKEGAVTVKLKSLPRPDFKLDKPFTIVLNGIAAELVPSDDGETDEDGEPVEKDIAEAAEEVWLKEHPEFKGCFFIADEAKAVIVPVMQQNVKESVDIPFIYSVFGAEGGIITEEDVTVAEGKAVYTDVCKKISEKLGIEVGLCKTEDGTYYAVPNTDGSVTNKNSNSVKEKTVPTSCTVCFYGERVQVTPEMFEGKKEVTEKEFLKWVCSANGGGHDEFAAERGSWIDYDSKSKLAIPRFKAARKGAYTIDSDGYRIQDTPVGLFRVLNGVPESEGNSFQYKLPMIPKTVWGPVADFFQ